MKKSPFSSILFLSLIFTGCSQYQVIPESLENQVNHTLDFKQIRENPDNHQGELMVVGGEVLSVNRKQDATRIEVLQLPLNEDYTPANQRTKTQGRFIALSKGKDPLDPAVLEEGRAISIVGEIIGRETIQVGEDSQEVPIFGIKDLTIWDEALYGGRGYSGFRWGRGYPTDFYSGYRPLAYSYY
ncbi:Slp family lipoprotein [Nitrospira sp. MA-1]|nr:Slp family lipoprotein [Nitrospira sp. MA-1]